MGNMCVRNPHVLQGDTAISGGSPVVDLIEEESFEKIDSSWSIEKQFKELVPPGTKDLSERPTIGSLAAQETKKKINQFINIRDMDIKTYNFGGAPLKLPSGDVCIGNWAIDKKMYKEAEIFLKSGGYYKGNMNKSEPVYGLLIHPNGDYYHGSFKGFNASGSGHFVSKDGYEYKGYWENDKMHHPDSIDGKMAEYQKKDVFKYIGYFKNGQKQGRGILEVFNVFKYEGDFECDEIHGEGQLTFLDGSERSYIGHFENSKKVGKGKFNWPKLKAMYEGEYQADMKHGKGKMTFLNGATYEGYFQCDKMHGDGILTLLDDNKGLQVKFDSGKFCESKQDNSSESSKTQLNQDDIFQLEMDDYDESLPQTY